MTPGGEAFALYPVGEGSPVGDDAPRLEVAETQIDSGHTKLSHAENEFEAPLASQLHKGGRALTRTIEARRWPRTAETPSLGMKGHRTVGQKLRLSAPDRHNLGGWVDDGLDQTGQGVKSVGFLIPILVAVINALYAAPDVTKEISRQCRGNTGTRHEGASRAAKIMRHIWRNAIELAIELALAFGHAAKVPTTTTRKHVRIRLGVAGR